ncbi:hypothetical protein Tco_1316110 [Tanacetum coccineum]
MSGSCVMVVTSGVVKADVVVTSDGMADSNDSGGGECAISLNKLSMPPHLHKKFCMGVAIAKGCKGYYKPGTRAWVRRGSRKIRISIDMYPCRVEERKFPEYKPTKKEEEISKLKAICENVIYDISDSDSDLESTARSGPRDSEIEDTGGSGIRITS